MSVKKTSAKVDPELSIEKEKWHDWHIIKLDGKFVVQSFAPVRNDFDSIESEKTPKIALDMSGITLIDSSALTIVLNLQKRLKDKGGELAIFGPNALIKETLLIVGFNMAVPIYNTRAMFEQSVGPH
jgi:anti-anti-sigma factor